MINSMAHIGNVKWYVKIPIFIIGFIFYLNRRSASQYLTEKFHCDVNVSYVGYQYNTNNPIFSNSSDDNQSSHYNTNIMQFMVFPHICHITQKYSGNLVVSSRYM